MSKRRLAVVDGPRRAAVLETVLAGLSFALLVLAVLAPDWIEAVAGVRIDGGSGALELGLPIVLAALGTTFALRAWAHWQQDADVARGDLR
jgi:hypothetical protein